MPGHPRGSTTQIIAIFARTFLLLAVSFLRERHQPREEITDVPALEELEALTLMAVDEISSWPKGVFAARQPSRTIDACRASSGRSLPPRSLPRELLAFARANDVRRAV